MHHSRWLLGTVLVLTACSAGSTTAAPTPSRSRSASAAPTHDASTCPIATVGGQSQVDYIDFLQWDGRQYLAPDDQFGRSVPNREIATMLGHTRCELSALPAGARTGSPQDGDAAYLPAGSPVYAVKGFQTTFRLAVRTADGTLHLYEVDSWSGTRTGADLLDIADHATRVEILDGSTETDVLGAITDGPTIHALVGDIEGAPAGGDGLNDGGPTFYVRFWLDDGTSVTRAWFPDQGLLWRGIRLPASASAILHAALNHPTTG